jgi:hypothetical protein
MSMFCLNTVVYSRCMYSIYCILFLIYLLLYTLFSFQIIYCLYTPRIYILDSDTCSLWYIYSGLLIGLVLSFLVCLFPDCLCICIVFARHSTALLELETKAFCYTCYNTCKSVYATDKVGFDLSLLRPFHRQLVARFHCISCDRPVDMLTPGP